MLGTALLAATAGSALAGDDALTAEQRNLAYCSVVLTHAAYGGERPGDNDPGSADVLIARLAKLLKSTPAALGETVLQQVAGSVAADMNAKGRPRFSPTACAGYAHYIHTTPLP
jgi:hypothetical protein